MKTFIALIFTMSLFSLGADAKTRIAVSTFKDKTGDSRCTITRWWGKNLGSGFKDQLMTALHRTKKFSLQERENLKTMYSEEHNLINSDKSAAPKANQFKAAHYSITGAITKFEMCSKGMGGNLNVGKLIGLSGSGLKVGGKKSSATVGIDLRVIDVETGEVVATVRTSGKSSSTKFKVDGNIKGAGFDSEAFSASPIGKATEIAVKKAAKKIAKKLPNRSRPKAQAKKVSKKKRRRPASTQ